MSPGNKNLRIINSDLLISIISFCSSSNLLESVCFVNKEFYKLVYPKTEEELKKSLPLWKNVEINVDRKYLPKISICTDLSINGRFNSFSKYGHVYKNLKKLCCNPNHLEKLKQYSFDNLEDLLVTSQDSSTYSVKSTCDNLIRGFLQVLSLTQLKILGFTCEIDFNILSLITSTFINLKNLNIFSLIYYGNEKETLSIGFHHLTKLKHLSIIVIKKIPSRGNNDKTLEVNAKIISSISQCKNLETLKMLDASTKDDNFLLSLLNLSKLTKLTLFNVDASKETLKTFMESKMFKNLNNLSLTSNNDIFSGEISLPHLKLLHFTDFTFIHKNFNLESLTIKGNCDSFVDLSLHCLITSTTFVTILNNCPKLKTCTVNLVVLENIEKINIHDFLEELTINITNKNGDPYLFNKLFAGFPMLRFFKVSYSNAEEDQMEYVIPLLQSFPDLKEFSYTGNLTEKLVTIACNLKSLRRLTLIHCSSNNQKHSNDLISPEVLSQIRNLQNLEYLETSEINIGHNDVLESISKLKYLQEFKFEFTNKNPKPKLDKLFNNFNTENLVKMSISLPHLDYLSIYIRINTLSVYITDPFIDFDDKLKRAKVEILKSEIAKINNLEVTII
jgi:hypothetical protein